MAWDVEGTKQRLLDAATAEFSRHGLAGARVDRIAESAGVNKERIYSYFGGKDALFGAVLEAELARVLEAVPLEGRGIEAVTSYAGRVFDYQSEHPQLARLTFWEGLEGGAPAAEEMRAAGAAAKIARLQAAVPELDRAAAAELLLTILTLCDGWQVLPALDRLYTGGEERDGARIARRRAAIVATVEATVRGLLAG